MVLVPKKTPKKKSKTTKKKAGKTPAVTEKKGFWRSLFS